MLHWYGRHRNSSHREILRLEGWIDAWRLSWCWDCGGRGGKLTDMEQIEAEKCQNHDRRYYSTPPSRHREFAVCATMKRRIQCYLQTNRFSLRKKNWLMFKDFRKLTDQFRDFFRHVIGSRTRKHWDLNRLCPEISPDSGVKFVSSHKSVYMQPHSKAHNFKPSRPKRNLPQIASMSSVQFDGFYKKICTDVRGDVWAELVQIPVFPSAPSYMVWSSGFSLLIWGTCRRFLQTDHFFSRSLERQPVNFSSSTGWSVSSGQFSPFLDLHLSL
jgi:hypothetical protein